MSIVFFTYKWTNKSNGMIYIGSHSGKIDDNYKGSGKYFKRAYKLNPENFEREIIEFYPNKIEMLEAERKLLQDNKVADNPIFYNLTECAYGGSNHKHLSEKERKEIYTKANKASVDRNRSASKEEKEITKLRKQESWKKSPKLKSHSENVSIRRKNEELKKTDEEKTIFSNKCKESYYNRGVKNIEVHHKKIKESVKQSYINNPELIAIRTEHFKNINTGRIYINKDGKSKRIYPTELQQFIDNGWNLGMTKRKS